MSAASGYRRCQWALLLWAGALAVQASPHLAQHMCLTVCSSIQVIITPEW